MRKNRLLFVVRDIVPARIAVLLIGLAKVQGYIIRVIAEGKALEIFLEQNIPVEISGDESFGSFDKQVAKTLIKQNDALVIGCSSPTNWELTFAEEANLVKVPVVAIADIWGALGRLKGCSINLALTMDDSIGTEEATRTKKIAVIGDFAEYMSQSVGESTEHTEHLQELHKSGKQTVLIVGDRNDLVVEICRVVASSILLTPKPSDFVVIPRLVHPKQTHLPEVATIVKNALDCFDDISVDEFLLPTRANTDWLAKNCTYTATSFSTPGRIALHAGKRSLTIQTLLCKSVLKEETGLDHWPLLEAGAELCDGTTSIGENHENSTVAKNWAMGAKFNLETGLKAIEFLLAK